MPALAFIGAYAVLVGIASFLEQPLARELDAYRLDAALRLGALVLALAALLTERGPAHPSLALGLSGLGIGLILGVGSVFYCMALSRMPPWQAASVANGYVAVTVILGVLVLGEALTGAVVAGLALMLAGVAALSWRDSATAGDRDVNSILALWPLGGYIVLVGLAAFLEKPALGGLTALQLNALTALGMAVVGVAAVIARDHCLPTGSAALAAAGVGVLIGLGGICYYLGLARVPVSIAAPLGNANVLVTALLAVVFRHQRLTPRLIGGAAATFAGVGFLTLP